MQIKFGIKFSLILKLLIINILVEKIYTNKIFLLGAIRLYCYLSIRCTKIINFVLITVFIVKKMIKAEWKCPFLLTYHAQKLRNL